MPRGLATRSGVLDRLCRQHDVRQIVSHRLTGTLWARRRDECIGKLADAPVIEVRDAHAPTTRCPRDSDPVRQLAWENDETGLPFPDACLRCLRATGSLNVCRRSMAISVASHHLWLDWRVTVRHPARMVTDCEPGIRASTSHLTLDL